MTFAKCHDKLKFQTVFFYYKKFKYNSTAQNTTVWKRGKNKGQT